MVKKELELLEGPPEFEKYTEEVRFPSNIPANIKDKVLEKVSIRKNSEFKEGMSDEEILDSVENLGELMKEAQNVLLDFACKHADKDITKQNLTQSAADKILEEYTDDIDGVEVKKK